MTLRPALARIAEKFAWGRVLVVGDVIGDEWWTGSCTKVAREAPVPTVNIQLRELTLGGAGNTAVNVSTLRGRCQVLTAIGNDEPGRALIGQLRRRAVVAQALQVHGRATVVKRRIVAGRQVLARFDDGDGTGVPEEVDTNLAGHLRVMAAEADVVVLADYGLGVCAGPAVRCAIAEVAKARPLLVDAHDVRGWAFAHPTVVTPNWAEVAEIIHAPAHTTGPARRGLLEAGRRTLLSATGADCVLATLDGDGAALLTAEGMRHIPTRRVDDPHSAGAGDTLTAALALGLAVGADLPEAAEIAVAAATVVVQRPGTATCAVTDLVAGPDSTLLTPEQLVDVCREHRLAGRRVGFTNGCFDVLHAGHVAFLRAAAAEVDVLVVAVNSDAGVRAIKGPGRPVNVLADRAEMLAAMDTVDHVVGFDGPAPTGLIEAIRPEVYVKGADHDVQALPEARLTAGLGGAVVTVPLLPDRSTSGVIEACAAAQRASA